MNFKQIDPIKRTVVGYMIPSVQLCSDNPVVKAFVLALKPHIGCVIYGDRALRQFLDTCQMSIDCLNEMDENETFLSMGSQPDGVYDGGTEIEVYLNGDKSKPECYFSLIPVYGFVTLSLKL